MKQIPVRVIKITTKKDGCDVPPREKIGEIFENKEVL